MSSRRAPVPPPGGYAATELVHALADATGWPRTRPARLLVGDRSATIGSIALCVSDAALDSLPDDADAVLLASPPTQLALRRGRRAQDLGDDEQPTQWRRAQRVVLDASELLAGAPGGFDDLLAGELGIGQVAPLAPVARDEYKLVGFVPVEALEAVRGAVFAAGAGVIGEYTKCSWSTTGTGTFLGGDHANPAVGSAGSFEQVEEVRFEVVCPTRLRDAVCRAFVRAHPYEEPAYDVYVLATPSSAGAGRVGTAGAGLAAVGSAAEQRFPSTLVMGGIDPAALRGTGVAITTQPASAILGALLDATDVGVVVCGGASEAERAVLAERSVQVISIPRDTMLETMSERLCAMLSRRLGIGVRAVVPLTFPTGQPVAQPAPTDPAAPPAAVPAQLWFDGGSRGNPGPAACAYVLYDTAGQEIERQGDLLGHVTNNVAEYNGLIRGLTRALDLGATRLEVYSDSELIVKQVRGEYRVKHEAMKPLHQQATQLLSRLAWHEVQHVLRNRNAIADALVNETLDAGALH